MLAPFLVLCSTACFEDPDSRFAAQRSLGEGGLEDGLTTVSLEPGAEPQLATATAVSLAASAPTPQLVLERLDPREQPLTLVLANVFADAELVPTVSRVTGTEGCPPEGAGQAIVLGPLRSETINETTHQLDLIVPGCARIQLEVVPDVDLVRGNRALNLAVIGETKGNLGVLADIVERLGELAESGEWAADAIAALGNLANSPQELDLLEWQSTARGANLPLIVAFGKDEVLGTGLMPFHRVFGRSDFSAQIGFVRLFVMDTASSGLSDSQLDFWRSELAVAETENEVRLAFMQTPPLDPAGARDSGFTSRIQAAQLVALLGDNGVDAVFTGGLGGFERFSLGGIRFFATGGGGGPVEALEDLNNHFLKVTISPDGTVMVEAEEIQ